MVREGKGRIYKRKNQDIYLLYLPKDVAEDSMFPFKRADSIYVKVSFKIGDSEKLLIEQWKEPEDTE